VNEENVIPKKIADDSSSVQVHLGILQGVITRMATNSSQCKAWCITVVSAILVIIADKGKPEYALIALLPIFLFTFLDLYYLALERGFRGSYVGFINKLHKQEVNLTDLYEVKVVGTMYKLQLCSFFSFSILGFYLGLTLLVLITKNVALT